jgi:hypothetical protein
MDRKEQRTLLVVAGRTTALFCLIVVQLIPEGNRHVGRRIPSPILFLYGLRSGAETSSRRERLALHAALVVLHA